MIILWCWIRCDLFGDAAFHEFLGQFRVFELFAYRHPLAGPYQPGQISVEGMMGKACEFHISGFTVCTSREGYAEYLGGRYGVIGESLVEVADTKQQYCVWMFLFYFLILLYQWCFCNLFCHRLVYLVNSSPPKYRSSQVRRKGGGSGVVLCVCISLLRHL